MHVIRLRKPWTKTLGQGGAVCRIDVPEQTVSDPQANELVAHYQRRFNRPPRLLDSSVHLRIAGWCGQLISLSINQTTIPVSDSSASIDVEVTPLLRPHNQLLLTLKGTPGTPPRLSGEVALGIQERPAT